MSLENLKRLAEAPIADVLHLLLLQFNQQPMTDGPGLSATESGALVSALAAGRLSTLTDTLIDALCETVHQSQAELWERWNLDFASSLRADISRSAAWESTADLLQIANDKADAEQRIVVASALLVACGKYDYASFLVDVIKHDAGLMDVDALIARRVLLHVSAVDGSRADWLAQVQAWLATWQSG